jgi:hypothetical protein
VRVLSPQAFGRWPDANQHLDCRHPKPTTKAGLALATTASLLPIRARNLGRLNDASAKEFDSTQL